MKKILALMALCLLAVSPVMAADAPKAGTQAPAFTLPSQDGSDVSLSDFHGKWVVLYFYPKDFTAGCSIEAHNFQKDMAQYQAKNAVIVGVSVDSVSSHKEFCAKQGLDFKLLADTQHTASKAYVSIMTKNDAIMSARNTFVIDPKGVIRKSYIGVSPISHSKDVLADLAVLQTKKQRSSHEQTY